MRIPKKEEDASRKEKKISFVPPVEQILAATWRAVAVWGMVLWWERCFLVVVVVVIVE